MTRTTLCLHESVLKQAKKLAHDKHKTLGETITELLSIGLQNVNMESKLKNTPFSLPIYDMGKPLIPLEDKEALSSLFGKKIL